MIRDWNTNSLKKIIFHICFVDAHVETPKSSYWAEGKREEKRRQRISDIQEYLLSSNLSLISFINTQSPVRLKCKVCEHEWTVGYVVLMKKIPDCPNCKPRIVVRKQTVISAEDRVKKRANRYYEKILQKSKHTIIAMNYIGAKDDVDAVCVICGHKWKIRADHLADRCLCPVCRKKNKYR